MVKSENVRIVYKPTSEMLADARTKPVNKPKFLWFRDKIGVQDCTDVRLRGRVNDSFQTPYLPSNAASAALTGPGVSSQSEPAFQAKDKSA